MTLGLLVLILILAFIMGEAVMLGGQFWLVKRWWRLGQHISLGTLVLGLFSVPAVLGILTFFIRGP